MKLDDIGFYTLSEKRALHTSISSPLYRCEMILTGRCNFKCDYCRKVNSTDIDYKKSIEILNIWIENKLKNVRFSGGEPTLYKKLPELIKHCKKNNVERIAISTNGSADLEMYLYLVKCGVNDFSISLDACCSIDNDKMNGVKGYWNKIIENIKKLSKITYVTVGVVLDEKNIDKIEDIIEFSNSLGVSDIRVIPSAQYSEKLNKIGINKSIIEKYPILKYRLQNEKVRGLNKNDSPHCFLMLDDMACDNFGNHYPCIIYLREKGRAIGKIDENVRETRRRWILDHNCLVNKICKNNCLDVCRDYNNFIWNRSQNDINKEK